MNPAPNLFKREVNPFNLFFTKYGQRSDLKPDLKPGLKSDLKPGLKPGLKSDLKPGLKPDLKPVVTKKKLMVYPESDGKPMAENTKQYNCIVMIKENLEIFFTDDVFIAADLFWYPVEGDNKTRRAPDIMVAIGRPKGDKGSYLQWEENNTPPQVVFEILSPGNTKSEMDDKFDFYNKYGVLEYYIYDPNKLTLKGYRRVGRQLEEIPDMNGWISPNLEIKFEMDEKDGLKLYGPNGEPFRKIVDIEKERKKEKEEKEKAELRADKEKSRADNAEKELILLMEKLKDRGISI